MKPPMHMEAHGRGRVAAGLAIAGGLGIAIGLAGCGKPGENQDSLAAIAPTLVWTNSAPTDVWVESLNSSRRLGGCGILVRHSQKGFLEINVKLEMQNTVVWRLKTESESSFRTNSLDVSAIPPGNHRGTLVLELTTNLTWRASLAAE